MVAEPNVSPSERRHETRQRICLDGEIIFDNGRFTFDCLVPSWSDVGARLILLSTVGIPDRFVLNIKYIGQRWPVRVVWRDEGSLGVEFADCDDEGSSLQGAGSIRVG